jgi:hypothetical protein
MTLTTEDGGDIPNVTPEDIDRVLPADAFGKFAILSVSATEFIQAGNDWQPDPACSQFLQQHNSDPWILEYRDGASGQQFRAVGWVSLEHVRVAFLSYLAGTETWRTTHEWHELHL